MTYPIATILLLALTLALFAGMWWGWRRRARRTGAGLAELPAAPDAAVEPLVTPVEGVYVSSTSAGDWLDRVAAQDLGVRSAVRVSVRDDGVLLARQGARDVFVPRADLVAVRRDAGIAGKVVGRGGIVVLTWRVGETLLDTGVKPRYRADRDALVAAVEALVAPPPGTTTSPTKDAA